MYHRQKIDEYLQKKFTTLDAYPTEVERVYQFNNFFQLQLDVSRLSDYEVLFASVDPIISVVIKDKKNGQIYTANYENNSTLLKAQAEHIKFINISISLADRVEREKTFFRFCDFAHPTPLHDEIYATFDGRYKLTLVKKSPSWYRPIESGVYLTLSDTKEYFTKFHTKIFADDDEFLKKNPSRFAFEFTVHEFIENKDIIFNKIMKKLND